MQTLVRASSSSLWIKQDGETLSLGVRQQQHVSRVNNWLIISHSSERDFSGGWELVWLNRLLVHVYRTLHTQWDIKWIVLNPPILTYVHAPLPSLYWSHHPHYELYIKHSKPFCFNCQCKQWESGQQAWKKAMSVNDLLQYRFEYLVEKRPVPYRGKDHSQLHAKIHISIYFTQK